MVIYFDADWIHTREMRTETEKNRGQPVNSPAG